MLKLIGLLATAGAGFGWARNRPQVDARTAAVTLLFAGVAQWGLQLVLPHGAIEQIEQAYRSSTSGQMVLASCAILESLGLLLAVALVSWSNRRGRTLATSYLLGAAFLETAAYHFPFDVVIVNGEVMVDSNHPEYGLAPFLCLPFAAIGYLAGWVTYRRRRSLQPEPRT